MYVDHHAEISRAEWWDPPEDPDGRSVEYPFLSIANGETKLSWQLVVLKILLVCCRI